MNNEIRLAFAHPIERAKDAKADTQMDRISVRNHTVDVEIGAFQTERGVTQRVCFNIVVEVLPSHNIVDDDVDKILSYDKITEAIAIELDAERLNLLETLAERVADRILREPQAHRVFVRIEKLDRGPGALGVEIVRSTKPNDLDSSAAHIADIIPHPHVLYLDNKSIYSEYLTGWLNQLEKDDEPVVLCVGLPDRAYSKAENTLAQRRIDLLAIEQNAWVLAARDKRCVVVATKTELDWAMKHGQISVWAPSKMILDATHPPKSNAGKSHELAQWLAEQLDAKKISILGNVPSLKTNSISRVEYADMPEILR